MCVCVSVCVCVCVCVFVGVWCAHVCVWGVCGCVCVWNGDAVHLRLEYVRFESRLITAFSGSFVVVVVVVVFSSSIGE